MKQSTARLRGFGGHCMPDADRCLTQADFVRRDAARRHACSVRKVNDAGDGGKAQYRRPGRKPGRDEAELAHGQRYAIDDEEQKAEPDADREHHADAAAAAETHGQRDAEGDHRQRRHEEADSRLCHQV